MIRSRDVLAEAKSTLEEWLGGSYIHAGEGMEAGQYRVTQLDMPGLVFEFTPTLDSGGVDVQPRRFRVIIGVHPVDQPVDPSAGQPDTR